MAQLITLRPSLLAYQNEVVIDDTTLILDIEYRARTNDWFLSVYDSALSPIVEGVRVVSSYPLLRGTQDSRLPDGQLWAIREGSTQENARIGELGTAVLLYYATRAELDAILAAQANTARDLITPQAIKSIDPVVP